jgi:hypothetical protein
MLPVAVSMVSRPLWTLLVTGVGLPVDEALPLLPAAVAAVAVAMEVGAADEEPREAKPAEKLDEDREVVHPAAPDERKLDAIPSLRDPPAHASAHEGLPVPGKLRRALVSFPPALPLP